MLLIVSLNYGYVRCSKIYHHWISAFKYAKEKYQKYKTVKEKDIGNNEC